MAKEWKTISTLAKVNPNTMTLCLTVVYPAVDPNDPPMAISAMSFDTLAEMVEYFGGIG